jgi:hypothetical protein
MADIQIIGKKGSKSRKAITTNTGIPLYTGRGPRPDAIVNYGLAGDRLQRFFIGHPLAKSILMLNKYIGHPKQVAVARIGKSGMLVPDTAMSLPKSEKVSDWIEKRVNSSQGVGICYATHRKSIPGKYYQRMIKERLFELRAHAFIWLPVDEWVLQKRLGPQDQIAWNFSQGGHFQSVPSTDRYGVYKETRRLSRKILDVLNMEFGAVDFIVDSKRNIYFIEINSSPGFTEYSQSIYFNAMNKLKNLSPAEIKNILKR